MIHVTVEIAKPQDLQEIGQLEQTLFSEPWSRQLIWNGFHSNQERYLVARYGEIVVGYLCYLPIAGEAELLRVAVAPAYQKNGIATILMREAFCSNEKDKLEKIFLEVRESNLPAITLYRKMGFQAIAIRKNYYKNPLENAVVMSKKVESENNYH